MQLFKIPKTFEAGLLTVLIVCWLLNLVFEKTSMGKWIAGHNFELYPLSSFSVYLWPKVGGAPLYSFEVEVTGKKTVEINAFDMFYPLEAPNLNDELAFKQIEAIEKSQRNGCKVVMMGYYKRCAKHPAKQFILPQDIRDMWLRSIAHRTGIQRTPEKITLIKTYYTFDPKTYKVNRTSRRNVLMFFPQKNWVAHVE